MTWQDLLNNGSIRRHSTSLAELSGLRAIVDRDLADAALPDLSADRRFATAYNAVLQLCKMAVACAGYRVTGLGAHATTFEAVELAMGSAVHKEAAFFETCRRKRNTIEYDAASVASETEAAELLEAAQAFRNTVEDWIAANYPSLVSPPHAGSPRI